MGAEIQSDAFWQGQVAQWLLKEFAALPTNGSTASITVSDYQQSEEW